MGVFDILFATFGSSIEVTEGSDGPLFNGFPTPHEALLEDELYDELDFAHQMIVCSAVMDKLYPLSSDEVPPEASPPISPLKGLSRGRVFIYTYNWHMNAQDYACVVLDPQTGNIVFDEWFELLNKHGVMDDILDVEGLARHLMDHGDLLDGDMLIVDLGPEDDE